MIERWGALVVRRAVAVLLIGLGITAAAGIAGIGLEDRLGSGGFEDPGTESARELVAERDSFGNRAIDAIIIFSSDDEEVSDPGFRAEVTQTLAAIPADTAVSVTSWYDARDPAMVSKDRHAIAVYVSLAGESQDDFSDSFKKLRPTVEKSSLDTDFAGAYAVYTDVNEETKADLLRAEIISMPFVLLLSLIIFRSVVAALMPLLVGLIAVLGARATIAGLNELVEVSIFAPNIITLLGLGLAIDYALFVVSRFREEIARTPDDTRAALVTTMATAGRTVAFSALTVAAAMSSLLVFPQTFLKSIGYGGMAAVLIAMLAALTVLPAALVLLGKRIDSVRIPFLQRSTPTKPAPADSRLLRAPIRAPRTALSHLDGPPARLRHSALPAHPPEDARYAANRWGQAESDHGAWARLAGAVMRRPVLVAVGVAAVLLAIASPFLGVKWGSVDYRVLPADTPSHQAAERLNSEFGPERSSANVILTGADDAALASYTQGLEGVDGVVDVRPVAAEGDTSLLRVSWDGNSQTEASQGVVRDLRTVESPEGTDALVGGLTADTVDLAESIGDHLPLMGIIVIGVMLVLLFVAFGSVVLPFKAVLMNAFSITASFGVITWIFSDGHLSDLLGFTPQGFLDLTNPIVMLAVLFGLSMDYEVFLLSRIREQWDAAAGRAITPGERNVLAVRTGVQKTGRIITSAALLLAVVIGAFSLSGVVFMKMLGLGMLVAILIDATVVRALLVPATMKLLGRWNWWAPGPLARWWERHGFTEGGEVGEARVEGPPDREIDTVVG